MRRPDHVRIGPVVWPISYDPVEMRRFALHADTHYHAGSTVASDARIFIDGERRPEAFVRETTLHEVLHAICFTYGVDGADDDAAKREEQWVNRLAAPLLDVLRDNPALVRYLTTTDTEES